MLTRKIRLMALRADNRGTAAVPFGYVYLSDETRIGYAPGTKMLDPIPGFPGLFAGNWGGNTQQHFRLAAEYLEACGVDLNPVTEKGGE